MKKEYIESRLQEEKEKFDSSFSSHISKIGDVQLKEEIDDMAEAEDGKHVFRKPPPKRKIFCVILLKIGDGRRKRRGNALCA